MAQGVQVRISPQFVTFPERVVTLAYGTQRQLGRSLDVLAAIAELRRAKELATDYVELPAGEQRGFVDETVGRLAPPPADAPAVCILDSGVNRGHPLLSPALTEQDMHTVNPDWGTADDRYQHGTEMAGIALYGNLADLFTKAGRISLRHRLESVKLLPPPPGENDRDNYGWVTMQAVARAEIQAPLRNRAICMAVMHVDRLPPGRSCISTDADHAALASFASAIAAATALDRAVVREAATKAFGSECIADLVVDLLSRARTATVPPAHTYPAAIPEAARLLDAFHSTSCCGD